LKIKVGKNRPLRLPGLSIAKNELGTGGPKLSNFIFFIFCRDGEASWQAAVSWAFLGGEGIEIRCPCPVSFLMLDKSNTVPLVAVESAFEALDIF
jgi:hypothetical protein